MVTATLKQEMDRITGAHGYAAPTEWLAAVVGWQGRWYPQTQAKEIARVAQLLAEAAAILERLEREEAK